MNEHALTLIISSILIATSAHTASIALIKDLESYSNKRVTVSGMVSWVEGADEFTLADETGDIEVNLSAARRDISEGDFVTVEGVVDETLIDEIDDARVTIINQNYDSWHSTYFEMYDMAYDGGMARNFRDTVDWNAEIYDDYFITTVE